MYIRNDLHENFSSENIQTAFEYSKKYLTCFKKDYNKTFVEEINGFPDRIKMAFFYFLQKEANILIKNNDSSIQSSIQKIDKDFNVSTSNSSESCTYCFQFLNIKSYVFKEIELFNFYNEFDHYFNDCYRKEQVLTLFRNIYLKSEKMVVQLYSKNKALFHLKIQKLLKFLDNKKLYLST